MALGKNITVLSCDKCGNKEAGAGDKFWSKLEKIGWYRSENTGHYFCPQCHWNPEQIDPVVDALLTAKDFISHASSSDAMEVIQKIDSALIKLGKAV